TNIKILEAMAMGKAIVSTPAGINGLDLEPGVDVVVAETAEEMAAAIQELIDNPARRRELEVRARQTSERRFDWDTIAQRQKLLWGRMQSCPTADRCDEMNFALRGDRLQQADRADFAIHSHGNVRPQPTFRHQL